MTIHNQRHAGPESLSRHSGARLFLVILGNTLILLIPAATLISRYSCRIPHFSSFLSHPLFLVIPVTALISRHSCRSPYFSSFLSHPLFLVIQDAAPFFRHSGRSAAETRNL